MSAREHEEVSEYERHYSNGNEPRVLDIMDVVLAKPKPHAFQQENWLFDSSYCWAQRGQIQWSDLASLAETDGALWLNGHHTRNGYNDRMPLTLTQSIRSSLMLISVDRLDVSVFTPEDVYIQSRRRVQAHFVWRGEHYRLWVTDPEAESEFLHQPDGIYRRSVSYLTISLGEPFGGSCFKLIAAVIERNRGATP